MRVLEEVGCIVIGPVSTVADAMSSIAGAAIDAAVLDVNLHAEKSLHRNWLCARDASSPVPG
jgi:hypothetical protein